MSRKYSMKKRKEKKKKRLYCIVLLFCIVFCSINLKRKEKSSSSAVCTGVAEAEAKSCTSGMWPSIIHLTGGRWVRRSYPIAWKAAPVGSVAMMDPRYFVEIEIHGRVLMTASRTTITQFVYEYSINSTTWECSRRALDISEGKVQGLPHTVSARRGNNRNTCYLVNVHSTYYTHFVLFRAHFPRTVAGLLRVLFMCLTVWRGERQPLLFQLPFCCFTYFGKPRQTSIITVVLY